MEVSWTQHALDSLERLFEYGRLIHSDRSIEYATQIVDFCDSITLFPYAHPICLKLDQGDRKYRSAVFDKRYRIIYKVEESQGQIFILDVFHTSQSPDAIKRLKNQ